METKQIQSSMTLNITSFLHSPKPSMAKTVPIPYMEIIVMYKQNNKEVVQV